VAGFSFFADFSKQQKSANLLFADAAKNSKTAKVTTLMKVIFGRKLSAFILIKTLFKKL
jgi:hypothetical protein